MGLGAGYPDALPAVGGTWILVNWLDSRCLGPVPFLGGEQGFRDGCPGG